MMEVQVIVFPNRNIDVNNLGKDVLTLGVETGFSRISDFRKGTLLDIK